MAATEAKDDMVQLREGLYRQRKEIFSGLSQAEIGFRSNESSKVGTATTQFRQILDSVIFDAGSGTSEKVDPLLEEKVNTAAALMWGLRVASMEDSLNLSEKKGILTKTEIEKRRNGLDALDKFLIGHFEKIDTTSGDKPINLFILYRVSLGCSRGLCSSHPDTGGFSDAALSDGSLLGYDRQDASLILRELANGIAFNRPNIEKMREYSKGKKVE